MPVVSIYGAVLALVVAIFLILKKVPPVYGMIAGALLGALVGGVGLPESVTMMMDGAKGIIPAVLRILCAGILAGVLIESGAARVIAETLVEKIGQTRSLVALALATLILTAVGVFIDVAVITVSPIAIAIAGKASLSRFSILLAMVGGGKAGNIISPNPNAIAASDFFGIPLTSLMVAGIIPCVIGLVVTCILASKLKNKGNIVEAQTEKSTSRENLPSFFTSILAPLVAIVLLSLRPIANIVIDPMIALPVGGIIGALCMGKIKNIINFSIAGLNRMSGVAIMLIGTGALAGVISNSEVRQVISDLLNISGLPSFLLAPISGALMSFATASTTAGTSVACAAFGETIVDLGVSSIAAAAMIHAGATVLDHVPHGSFFHATGGAVGMDMKERLKLIPYESLVGISLAIVSTIVYGVILG